MRRDELVPPAVFLMISGVVLMLVSEKTSAALPAAVGLILLGLSKGS